MNSLSYWILVTVLLLAAPPDMQSPVMTDAASGVQYTIEKYLTANYPVSLAFAPDGRLFYTEKTTGNVRVVSPEGILQREPVIHLETSAVVERGMLGIALDPDYATNGYIWVYHTAAATARDYASNRVVRFREENGVGSDPQIMLDIPLVNQTVMHNGGNLHFDDEGFLYVSVGDYENAANAQDMETLQGKIHRFMVTDAGLVPAPGNPFAGSSIYAFGLRNPYDFTFDPLTGRIFATENGPTCDDEVNLILPGFNYGWGENYRCVGTDPVDLDFYAPPLLSLTPTEAPTGIIIYNHPAIPEWQSDLFFCGWNFGILRRVELNDARTQVTAVHELDLGDVQCRIDLEVGPEGALYFVSVNATEGGAIYRLVPVS